MRLHPVAGEETLTARDSTDKTMASLRKISVWIPIYELAYEPVVSIIARAGGITK